MNIPSDTVGARVSRLPYLPVIAWIVAYGPLALLEHITLQTNAYDLSTFDYALWSTLEGRLGHVPFMGHSLASHHAMPTLLAFLPLYAVWSSPVLLVMLQPALALAAALVLVRLLAEKLNRWVAAALVTAFLFARAPYNAFADAFYVESTLPLLVFLIAWAWKSGHTRLYWLFVALALGVKEDVALYLAAFSLLRVVSPVRRRLALATAGVSCVWLAVALSVLIPAARAYDGLHTANPFLEARFSGRSDESRLSAVSTRVISRRSATKLFNATSSVGLLCWAGPGWFAPALPGIALNLAARRETLQSALVGHYLFPILPFMVLGAAEGAARIIRRWPKAPVPIAILLLISPLVDTPLWLSWKREPWKDLARARQVRAALAAVALDGHVSAQSNLIPHLPHVVSLSATGNEQPAAPPPDVVLLTEVGDLWPLGAEGVRRRIELYRSDRAYEVMSSGPLWVFRRIRSATDS